MTTSMLVLSDGTVLSSGPGTVNALCSVRLTQSVNDAHELSLGSVCAGMLEARLITPGGGLSLQAGQELTLYRVTGDTREQVGVFILEKPTRPSSNTLRLTAYDRVIRLDKDLTDWLRALRAWPYSLQDFASMVCAACGVELVGAPIPNGTYPVEKFTAQDITGRQIMRWVGQIAGRFCRATPQGALEFAWYAPAQGPAIGPKPLYPVSVTFEDGVLTLTCDRIAAVATGEDLSVDSPLLRAEDDGQGHVTVTVDNTPDRIWYNRGALSLEDYAVRPIHAVGLRQSRTDVGVRYPEDPAGDNFYTLTGNPLLTASSAQALEAVARTLYEQLKDFTYTPCRVTVPIQYAPPAGSTVTVTDPAGNSFTALVMTKITAGQQATLEGTGSSRRTDPGAVYEGSYRTLSGKVLDISADVDGLRVENAQARGDAAALELRLGAITGKVTALEQTDTALQTATSTLRQTAQGLELALSRANAALGEKADQEELGQLQAHFHIGADGITLSNAVSGMGLGISQERIVFTGGNSPTTVVRPNDMQTTNLRVNTRLDLGNFSFIPRTNGNLSFRCTGQG